MFAVTIQEKLPISSLMWTTPTTSIPTPSSSFGDFVSCHA
jgi:hypothetical protein